MRRHLIVNADDFGWTSPVNAGVVAAHDHGIVTSASLMVRGAAVVEAVAMAAARPSLSLGLHVDLGEWVHDGRHWVQRYHVVDVDDAGAVVHEVDRQLDAFVELVGRAPSHLDGHQHVQHHEPAATAMRAVAGRLAVPLRAHDERIAHIGSFYGQDTYGRPHPHGVSTTNLLAVIDAVPCGWTEVGCHPGLAVDPSTTTYAAEREQELVALCDPGVRRAIEDRGIVLASYCDVHA